MIISASRRTDIPTYFSRWFFNRLREGFVYVRNPMNYYQVGKISLKPDVVDAFVFWTKNPIPMLPRIHELDGYTYYFQFTLNPYGRDAEPNVPPKDEKMVPVFQQLSKEIGRERVVWRYDPIFFNETYDLDYHRKSFRTLAEKLADYTETCTISFVDLYEKTKRNVKPLALAEENVAREEELAAYMADVGRELGFTVNACAEAVDLSKYGIGHASCIDRERLERIGNFKMDVKKDPNQRAECGCVESIDIGAYNSCPNGCLYCYANFSRNAVSTNYARHNPESPFLIGEEGPNDVIKERKMKSFVEAQMKLF